jgi:molybdopterin/thiamine biosynthesis adenylyltransferase
MLTQPEADRLRAALAAATGDAKELSLDQARHIAGQTLLTLRQVEWAAMGEGIVPRRYERSVPAIGLEGQRALLERCAAVVGLGGLGGCVVESLARLGVGRIVGIDPDAFAESNLNRQLLSRVDNVAEPKVAAAAARIGQINPAVDFEAHQAAVEQVGEAVLHACDLAFDCLDGIPARRELARRCAAAGVALVHGAIAGWCGQVGLCPPGSGLIERLYAGKDDGAERRAGNLPFTAAVAANLMVAEALPVLLGRAEAEPRLRFFDLQTGDWEAAEL